MNKYYVLELELLAEDDNYNDALDALEDSLQADGYDYYIASDPYANQIVVLVVPAKYINGTYTGFDEIIEAAGFSYIIK